MAFQNTNKCVVNITPKDVQIILGFTIRNYLGKYTYDSNQTRPAVGRVNAAEDKMVDGVELIIPSTPTFDRSTPSWECWLLARDTDSQTLDNLFLATRQLKAVFKQSRFVPMEANDDLGAIPQVKMMISGSEMHALGRRINHFN